VAFQRCLIRRIPIPAKYNRAPAPQPSKSAARDRIRLRHAGRASTMSVSPARPPPKRDPLVILKGNGPIWTASDCWRVLYAQRIAPPCTYSRSRAFNFRSLSRVLYALTPATMTSNPRRSPASRSSSGSSGHLERPAGERGGDLIPAPTMYPTDIARVRISSGTSSARAGRTRTWRGMCGYSTRTTSDITGCPRRSRWLWPASHRTPPGRSSNLSDFSARAESNAKGTEAGSNSTREAVAALPSLLPQVSGSSPLLSAPSPGRSD